MWPVWFSVLLGLGLFAEDVLGWQQNGPKWLAGVAAFSIFAIGLFLWRVVGTIVAARWGAPDRSDTIHVES